MIAIDRKEDPNEPEPCEADFERSVFDSKIRSLTLHQSGRIKESPRTACLCES